MSLIDIFRDLYSLEWELTYFWVILWPFHDSQFLIRCFETHSQTAQLENWLTYWGGKIKKRRFWKCVYSFQLPYTWPKHENPTLPSRYRFAWSFQSTWLFFRFIKSRCTAVQKYWISSFSGIIYSVSYPKQFENHFNL